MLVRDQEVGGSNPLAPTNLSINLQTFPPEIRVRPGSIFGPYHDPDIALHCRCSRVLINLPSDDFDDLLGLYQEVWSCTGCPSLLPRIQ